MLWTCNIITNNRACLSNTGLFVLVEATAVAVGCVMASRVLHAIILDRVLKAPMSYFDTTPLGRIINRFSKDMDVVDFNMPLFIRAWLFAIAPLLSTMVVICYTTPYFLIVMLPMGIVYISLQVRLIFSCTSVSVH